MFINRLSIGLFAVALFIFANDALGWGLIPLNHHDLSLSDVASDILSPAYKL